MSASPLRLLPCADTTEPDTDPEYARTVDTLVNPTHVAALRPYGHGGTELLLAHSAHTLHTPLPPDACADLLWPNEAGDPPPPAPGDPTSGDAA